MTTNLLSVTLYSRAFALTPPGIFIAQLSALSILVSIFLPSSYRSQGQSVCTVNSNYAFMAQNLSVNPMYMFSHSIWLFQEDPGHPHPYPHILEVSLVWDFFGTGIPPLEPFHQPCFVLGIFKIGSHKLFVWVGFKPQSS
jgi:hypothetical protein